MFPTLSIFWNAGIWSVFMILGFGILIFIAARRDWKIEKPKRTFGLYIIKRESRKGDMFSLESYARDRFGHLTWYAPHYILPWKRWNPSEPIEVCTEVFDIDKLLKAFPIIPFRGIDPFIQAILINNDQKIMNDLRKKGVL